MEIDTSAWTAEGTFTATLLEALKAVDAIAYVRVEDAPSSRAETGYAFISNEVYVRFRTRTTHETVRRFGIPWRRAVEADRMTLEQLGVALGGVEGVGQPDYADAGMLQYLRTERIVPPFQTKGVKVVELARIYLVKSQRLPKGT